ncbi:MAG: flagellar M-ring protein FliF [Treponema sp.]|nr:flagellar M-ring protein FliF [Treponema sp.]MBQ5385011.1 flagellar M-ring protein FliF [Treponema sp.]
MNEWFKKTFGTIKEKWSKWKPVQKLILIGIVVLVIAVIILLVSVSTRKTSVRLFNAPVEAGQQRTIVSRLEKDGIKADIDSDGYITVENDTIAKKYRSQLVAEGYEPTKVDPYSLFDTQKWSRTSFDDKVNWQRAQESALEQHLEQLDGIRAANVMLSIPETATFKNSQNPTTASVTLFPRIGSDVLDSKKSVKGIMHLIMRSVEGLKEEDITIFNGDTNEEVSDLAGLEDADHQKNVENQQKWIRKQEAYYQTQVINALQGTFGTKRVKIANMKIDMDMSERSYTATEYSGVTIKPDNPNTIYDDSEVRDSLVLSEETVDKKFTGTGYNPEGPAGTEGQNPPVYSDMSNVIGETTESGVKRNYVMNRKDTAGKEEPKIDRLTVSVNVDGTWQYPLYDPDTKKIRLSESGGYERTYVPISDDVLAEVTKLVQSAVGYDAKRGDSVVVTNIPFDHTDEFKEEDAKFIKSQKTKMTIFISLIAVALILVLFIAFRLISKEIERRRRIREEEELRRQQQQREAALWEAKEQGMEVTLSVEERKRAELQENAIAMAKNHPEDVAMLIRTWLMEE